MNITYRQADINDVIDILRVRHSVHENKLSDPNSITHEMCVDFLKHKGRAWVAEYDHDIVGFSCADLSDDTIWALFVLPAYEGQGIGSQLLMLATQWLFKLGAETINLSTDTGTRAEAFYLSKGWIKGQLNEKNEIALSLAKPKS